MCAYYRPTMYKESLYASPSEKELAIQKKKSQQLDLRDSYLRQMEEARQRKKLQKLLDKADDLIYLQTEKNFSPWGRGGGGAPLRDDMGDVRRFFEDVFEYFRRRWRCKKSDRATIFTND